MDFQEGEVEVEGGGQVEGGGGEPFASSFESPEESTITEQQQNTETFGTNSEPASTPVDPVSPTVESNVQLDDKYDLQLEEETPLSVYQLEHNKMLDERARKLEEKREEILQEAGSSIDDFYAKRTQTIEKKKGNNRKEEENVMRDRDALLAGTSSTNEWERVASLVDFKQAPIGRDTSRMRKLLIDLKH